MTFRQLAGSTNLNMSYLFGGCGANEGQGGVQAGDMALLPDQEGHSTSFLIRKDIGRPF